MWTQTVADPVFLLALLLGGVGGAAIVAVVSLSRRGPYVLVPYAALAVAVAVLFAGSEGVSYLTRVFAAFGAFLLATLFAYFAVRVHARRARERRREQRRHRDAVPGMGRWGRAWRMGAVLVMGFTASVLVALVGA